MECRAVISNCPGAEAFLADPKVIADPKSSPLIRLMTPNLPMDMVMIGSSGYWALTASVADKRVSTSLAEFGMQANLATSAPNCFMPMRRPVISSKDGVFSKSWLLMTTVTPCSLATARVWQMLSRLRKYSTSTASTLPLATAYWINSK